MTSDRKALPLLLVLDVLTTVFVFNAVGHIHGPSERLVLAPLAGPAVAIIFALYLIDGYRPRTDMMSLDYTSLHCIAVGSAMLGTLLLTYVFVRQGYELQSSRIDIAVSFVLIAPVTLGYRRACYRRIRSRRGVRSLVFLGDYRACVAFREECQKMGMNQPV